MTETRSLNSLLNSQQNICLKICLHLVMVFIILFNFKEGSLVLCIMGMP